MLDRRNPEQAVTGWIFSLPCHIKFPEKLRANFERSGPTTTIADDVRSGVRIHCCGNSHRAAIEVGQSLPAFPRQSVWSSVFTTNISKNGCGFFHHEVLYPSERFSMILLTGIKLEIEIVWCRRIDTHCFAVGSRFRKPSESANTGAKK